MYLPTCKYDGFVSSCVGSVCVCLRLYYLACLVLLYSGEVMRSRARADTSNGVEWHVVLSG